MTILNRDGIAASKVEIYMFDDVGTSVFSHRGYSPTIEVGCAITHMLRLAEGVARPPAAA